MNNIFFLPRIRICCPRLYQCPRVEYDEDDRMWAARLHPPHQRMYESDESERKEDQKLDMIRILVLNEIEGRRRQKSAVDGTKSSRTKPILIM